VRPKADKTFDGTHTAVQSFNRFWATACFNPLTEQSVHFLKINFAGSRDGFHALCLASHVQRNIMLSYYVAGIKRKKPVIKADGTKKKNRHNWRCTTNLSVLDPAHIETV
jgi:hypothetical protein